jgi:hypothetical protein
MPLRPLVLLLFALTLVAGCGGGSGADADTDPQELLADTFSGGKAIESGRIALTIGVETDAGGQPIAVKLSGPFASQGENRLPLLDLDASIEGGGQSLSGGVVTTEDRGYVSFGGETYEVSGPIYEQFKAGFEQAAKESAGEEDRSLAALGIDPRRWLTNAKNAGEAKVGDTDTIKITGDVDVAKLLDDVNAGLQRIRALGVQGSEQLPEQLTDEEKRATAEAIEDLSVEIYTGAEDRILRRIVVALGVQAPEGQSAGGATTADVRFDLQLQEVNEDQEIEAPENAKPFEELLSQLEGLGAGLDLGGLGGGGSGSQGDAPSGADLEEYSQCVQEAAGDNAKVRKCADLLTSP